MKKTRTQRVSIALVKEGVTTEKRIFKYPIKESVKYNKLGEKNRNYYIGKMSSIDEDSFPHPLYYKIPNDRFPDWVSFIESLYNGTGKMISSSPSAMILVKVNKRRLVVMFGYSRYFLRDEALEPLFGMKVVLGEVLPEKIRSTDAKSLDDLAMQTRKQAAKISSIQDFGIDPARDIMKQVSGEPEGEYFKSLAGSDYLTFSKEMDIEEVPDVCEEVLNLYKQDKYKENYEWVDKLRYVRESSIRKKLDKKLLDSINSLDSSSVMLSFPTIIDYHDLEYITYGASLKGAQYQDLDIKDYYEEDPNIITSIELFKKRLFYCKMKQHSDLVTHHVYRCINFETIHRKKRYFLSDGNWYEIEDDFVNEVINYCKSVKICGLNFESCKVGESEGAYNKRIGEQKGYFCLDQKLVKPIGASSRIEFSDLVRKTGKYLIHVKKRTSSSTLSHLYNQGLVSANIFRTDDSLRKSVRKEISDVAIRPMIPVGPPRPNEYEIVYAIISKKYQQPLEKALPIFSLVCLRSVHEQLRLMGYKVSVKLIEQET